MRFASRNNWIKLGVGVGIFLLIGPVAAMAQMQVPARTETVFRWLNFVFVFGVGGWWLWGKIKGVFRRKADSIAAAVAEAEAARSAAQARLHAAEEKLAGVEQESAEMRERARHDSAAETERIREMAREEAARIQRAADAEIAAAELAAANRLREMAIDKTIAYARVLVKERLTAGVDARLVGGFVGALRRSGEAS